MGSAISGGCLCGAVSFQVASAAKFGIRCYCTDCQKLTGAESLPQVAVSRADWNAAGQINVYISTSASGSELRTGFCGSCGSLMYKSTERAPDIMFIAAGAIDHGDIPALKPVFEDSRPNWG